MKINRTELLEALNHCKRALTSRGNVPVLGSYCFDGSTVYAYDGVIALTAPCSLSEFKGALPGNTLRQWLEVVSEEQIAAIVEESSTTWKAGRRRMKLEALSHADFVMRELPEAVVGFKLDEHFLDYLRVAATSMGTDEGHAWRLGVTIAFDGSDSLRMYASDNTTVACVSAEYEIPPEMEGTAIILPPQAVSAILATKGIPEYLGVSSAWTHFVYPDRRTVLARASADADAKRFVEISGTAEWAGDFTQVSEGLERSLREICKVARTTDLVRAELTVSGGELQINCTDGIVTIEDTTAFKGHADCSIVTNPALLDRALEEVDEIKLTERAVLMRSESVRVMVSTLV